MNEDLSNCSSSEPCALRVIGDEMAPEFVDGHILIVDPGGRVRSGCYVIAKVDDEMIFRQLEIAEGQYSLRTIDDQAARIPLANGSADLVGVVSQRTGKRRSEHKRYDLD